MIAGAILCIIVAVLALISPILFALMIVRLLGIFALVSGGISLFVAIFGKDVAPRWLNIVFALIRIVAGLVLLACVPSGLNIITLIFAAYLLVEGIFAIFGAFKIRGHKGWIFMLLNGVVTLILGLLVLRPLAYRRRLDSRVIFGH